MLKIESTGHFYDEHGKSITGNLRDARKIDGLPSITTVLKIIEKPALTKYKLEQILRASLSLSQDDSETKEEYIDRIIEESGRESKEAIGFGNNIHALAENYLKRDETVQIEDDIVFNAFSSVADWIDNSLVPGSSFEVEESMSSVTHGFAGKPDCFGETKGFGYAVIDWKSQKVKQKFMKRKKAWENKPVVYDDFVYQLAAIGLLVEENRGVTPDNYISVVISSNKINMGFVHVHVWDYEEVENAKEIFLSMLSVWRGIKKYPYRRK